LKLEPQYREHFCLPLGGRFCRAFTLIELLIVVAIIAVLAAIAVPNFLEAQTRAKVARVKADHRAIATGLDSYAIDHNIYPATDTLYTPMPSQRLEPITTPISYLTSIPNDPFNRKMGNSYEDSLRSHDPDEPLNIYLYNRESSQTALGGKGKTSYSLTSGGPDGHIHFPYFAFADIFIQSGTYINYAYDATNGTISSGEIFRRGGGARRAVPGIEGQ